MKVRNILLTAAMSAVLFCPVPLAGTTPNYCFDQRLCDGDFGSTHYCPDTGGFVSPFEGCDALVTGPYAPGGLSPNEGSTSWMS